MATRQGWAKAARAMRAAQLAGASNVPSSVSSGAAAALMRAPEGSAWAPVTPFGDRASSGLLAVKLRMKSVKNVQKITKAMKMVAASKLRGAQAGMENSRGFWQPFTAMFGDGVHVEPSKNLIVALTTDKGLCGGINSNIIKYIRALVKVAEGVEYPRTELLAINGEKGRSVLQRDLSEKIVLSVADTQKVALNFSVASLVAEKILESAEFDRAQIVFNRFASVISYKPTISTVMSTKVLTESLRDKFDQYEWEDGMEDALQDLSELQLAGVMYNSMLENATSEMGARMSAMDNSTRNATDMLGKLTLLYNRGRQAAITTELIEIISGASALEG
mmetsp:Transcript_3006/g.10849  ORF Transcript_3006/g.10849 Transcript_3006/m.10849 type:complete len:334 (+) Transcript_3006:71-1072(+)|eukprot:scaffold2250_cov399-Prasinococcus_capsulatus_cf.AAC.19